MARPTEAQNFCRVFELPTEYPWDYCFGGGKPVQMLMVDWFSPWPPELPPDATWQDVARLLRSFLSTKQYVKPGRRYLIVTEFGEAMLFTAPGTEGE